MTNRLNPKSHSERALRFYAFMTRPVFSADGTNARVFSIKKSLLIKLSYTYIAIPVLIFIVGWLRWYFSLPLLAAVLAALWFAFSDTGRSYGEERVTIPAAAAVAAAAVLLLWAITSGLGALYYQSPDYDYRNAIFHDLINFRWPVVYQNGKTALVYYVAFWLPAAAVGKFFGWRAANIALLLWAYAGLCLVYLSILAFLGVRKTKKCAAVLMILIFFSGLDFIGTAASDIINHSGFSMTLEWWNYVRQYSSVTTQLMWVFNQCIVPWLAIVLLMMQKNIKNVALILVLTLPFAPFPLLGLVPYAALALGVACVKFRKNPGELARNVFTFQNIAPTVLLLPVFFLYFASNTAVGSARSGDTGLMMPDPSPKGIFYLILFFILEFLVYYVPLLYKYWKDPRYILTGFLLFAIPFFRVGTQFDFTMRASIPALFVLMLYVMRFLTADGLLKRERDAMMSYILVIILTIGSITPFVEQWRALRTIRAEKKIACVADGIKTFSDKGKKGYENFLTVDPYRRIFYRYIARQ